MQSLVFLIIMFVFALEFVQQRALVMSAAAARRLLIVWTLLTLRAPGTWGRTPLSTFRVVDDRIHERLLLSLVAHSEGRLSACRGPLRMDLVRVILLVMAAILPMAGKM